ncbi:hypothetical protein [Streptomyces griseomycini]|uniref:Uncharacterized protein n=1 Tax=Streptomyces griseomycini TaxID=66895 RepID=A0A7W7VAM6_9ACTN|nr:hypothetical protein [Streptomyces griseomycini]MBB4903042.1 hypothetical protein [Streptomyces griseomycini]GGR50574.1 hypothetical protein GCM10015536_65140 [Streptomyces griseomycini]
MTQPTITALDTALDADQADTVLSAAWDAFDVAGRLADALAFDEGSDEIQATLVGIKCTEGRRLLPLPENDRPRETPTPCSGRAGLEPYGALLRHASGALRRLASVPEYADDAEQLSLVADHAAAAAALLMTVRQDGDGAS